MIVMQGPLAAAKWLERRNLGRRKAGEAAV